MWNTANNAGKLRNLLLVALTTVGYSIKEKNWEMRRFEAEKKLLSLLPIILLLRSLLLKP